MNMPSCSATGTRPFVVSLLGSCSSLRQASNTTNFAAERAPSSNLSTSSSLTLSSQKAVVPGSLTSNGDHIVDVGVLLGCAVTRVIDEPNGAGTGSIEPSDQLAYAA